jgi:hypothetical protein
MSKDTSGAWLRGLITLAVLLIGMPIVTGVLVRSCRAENRARERCAPYQMVLRFENRGHELVVCRTEAGLVVREVEK